MKCVYWDCVTPDDEIALDGPKSNTLDVEIQGEVRTIFFHSECFLHAIAVELERQLREKRHG